MSSETDLHQLETAIGAVLFNSANYPGKASIHMLGQDITPLRSKVVAAVLNILEGRDAEKKAEGWDEHAEALRKYQTARVAWALSDTSDPKPAKPKNPYRTPQQGEQG